MAFATSQSQVSTNRRRLLQWRAASSACVLTVPRRARSARPSPPFSARLFNTARAHYHRVPPDRKDTPSKGGGMAWESGQELRGGSRIRHQRGLGCRLAADYARRVDRGRRTLSCALPCSLSHPLRHVLVAATSPQAHPAPTAQEEQRRALERGGPSSQGHQCGDPLQSVAAPRCAKVSWRPRRRPRRSYAAAHAHARRLPPPAPPPRASRIPLAPAACCTA